MSDWSSDVCSSDLERDEFRPGIARAGFRLSARLHLIQRPAEIGNEVTLGLESGREAHQ